jgi:hypothetical protein
MSKAKLPPHRDNDIDRDKNYDSKPEQPKLLA